jgi:spore coat polysaccharide biosynthesis predicted glycosyltransferase SpsG/ribosomal protein S18 acetylase RimI-like enzyme
MNYIFIAFEELEEGLGTGHITRVKRIIDTLTTKSLLKNNTITFITNHQIHSSDYFHVYVKNIDEAKNEVINIITKNSVDVVIFDCLDYCQEIYEVCQVNLIFSIGIDTSNSNSKKLDLLINPAVYNKLSYLHGPMHSIHYEDIQELSSKNIKDIKKIFICFGGIDYQEHLIKISPLLKLLPKSYEINIVLSNQGHKKYIYSAKNIKLYYQPNNFYELLKDSNIAIISGGIIFQEALYLGIPTFVMPQYKHQYDAAKQRYETKSSLGFSNIEPNYKEAILKINHFLNDSELRRATSLNARSLDDGFGLKRFASLLRIYDYLEWDSHFFKKNIYNLNTKSYTPSVHKEVELLIEHKKVDLIYFLCPSGDKKSINLAKTHNFKQVDNRLTYVISSPSFKPRLIKDNAEIKLSTSKNIKKLESIAKNTKWTSRYFNDQEFSKEDLKVFYGQWIKKSVTGDLDDMVFHVELNNIVCGFISIKKHGLNLGSIGLVAVDQNYQGHGFGLALISHAVQYMLSDLDCALVYVVTQKENINACIAYDKIGFEEDSNSTWLHKWI